MNKFVVCFLAAGLAVAAQGANRYWYGTGDLTRPFTDPTNWKDSTPPVPGDNVLLRSYGKDLVVSDDDAALASTVSIIWDVNSHTVQDSLIWNVSTNASFSGIFGDWAGSKGFKTGRFIKRGTGDLNLVAGPSLGTTSYKSPHWVVERGVLRYPQFTTAPYAGWAAGETVVSNGATLVLLSGLDKETTTTFTKLVNYGVVTNECANRVTLATGGDVDDPSEIYGTILGNLRYTPYGSVNIYSTANTYQYLRPAGVDGLDVQVVGVSTFGAAGMPSPLGLSTDINYDYNGPIIRYLGTGEMLTRNIQTKLHANYATWNTLHPFSLDGGPYGNLMVTNIIYAGPNVGGTELLNMIIEGTNAAPCIYKAKQRIYTATDGNYRPLHTIKRGSGTWEFPFILNMTLGSKTPYMIGGFSIEEGTIRAEEITEKGQPSSLGAGTDCYGEYMGPYDATKRVDWSISFGTTNAAGVAETEGTLEFYGALKGYSSNRKMVL